MKIYFQTSQLTHMNYNYNNNNNYVNDVDENDWLTSEWISIHPIIIHVILFIYSKKGKEMRKEKKAPSRVC